MLIFATGPKLNAPANDDDTDDDTNDHQNMKTEKHMMCFIYLSLLYYLGPVLLLGGS